jgi:SAM-dependent methyltransferase
VKKELTTDLFGLAFRDFLDGDKDNIIDVRTKLAGFAEQEELPVSYFFRTVDKMPEWERLALDFCRGSVLDAGAGAGAHALELQKRGHEVYAIDISHGAVEVMKRRGVKKATCVSLLDLSGKKFDTMLFLMNGIGMAENLDGLKRIFLHTKSLLVPGGRIILESTDIMYMYREEDGSVLLPMGSKYYGEVKYQLSYRHHRGKPFPWLFVDSDNLCGIAEECGFVPEILYRGESDNYLAMITLPK